MVGGPHTKDIRPWSQSSSSEGGEGGGGCKGFGERRGLVGMFGGGDLIWPGADFTLTAFGVAGPPDDLVDVDVELGVEAGLAGGLV